jgi:hypothetical protein
MKIRALLPIYASAYFESEVPDNFPEMTDKEKMECVLENMETIGSVCHQCSNDIDTDFELNEDWVEKCSAKDFMAYLDF